MDLQARLDQARLSLQPPGSGQTLLDQAKQIISEQLNANQVLPVSTKLLKLQENFNQQIQAASTQTPNSIETGDLPDDIHFLNRLSYGPTPMLREQLTAGGWEALLEQQLDPENIDTSDIDNALLENFPTLTLTAKGIIDAEDVPLIVQVVTELLTSTILRQTYSPAQLYERMVEFWSDHFNMNILDAPLFAFKSTDDREAIRPNALGKFRDLLYANASSPAMLLYLDNYSNTKDGPNENYARELLELHTLGVNGGYTEADVVAVSRAFTGWTINPYTYEFLFFFPVHDRRNKEVLGTKIRRTFTGGISDAEQVLDLLASHPSTARFICSKLVRRFVSDQPPTEQINELIDELTQVFLDTDGDIKGILRALFNSNVFWASKEQKMKRPLDFLTSSIRRLGFEPSENTFRYLFTRLEQMGQIPFYWHAPDGYPDTAAYWTNTAALISRWASSNDISTFIPDDNLVAMLDGADTPNTIIQAVAKALIDRKLGTDERKAIRRNVFAGQKPNQSVSGNPLDYAKITASVVLGSRYFQQR
ncbi:MAG: DUF1800 domain-containing protein [Xanthomonadales bacterium]|nr:DUF1800 domain-containing protein [Xanthomonadales bacterium]